MGIPARLVIGEPLPHDVEVLPSPQALIEKCCGVAVATGEKAVPLPAYGLEILGDRVEL